jgi:hypothetical protein
MATISGLVALKDAMPRQNGLASFAGCAGITVSPERDPTPSAGLAACTGKTRRENLGRDHASVSNQGRRKLLLVLSPHSIASE